MKGVHRLMKNIVEFFLIFNIHYIKLFNLSHKNLRILKIVNYEIVAEFCQHFDLKHL